MTLNLINQTKQQLRKAILFFSPHPTRRRKEPSRNCRGQALWETQIRSRSMTRLLPFLQYLLSALAMMGSCNILCWTDGRWFLKGRGGFSGHPVHRSWPIIWLVLFSIIVPFWYLFSHGINRRASFIPFAIPHLLVVLGAIESTRRHLEGLTS